MKKTAVVTTTINMPVMIESFCKNAIFYNRKNIEFFVIGDKKTPAGAPKYCEKIASKYSFPIHYFNLKDQEKELKDYPKLLNIFPYNNADRKLLGMVMAYIRGFNVMITVDDDNYATNHDFFGYHGISDTEKELPLIESPSGWYNTCEQLIEENNIPVFHRGFPWSKRKVEKELITVHKAKRKVVVNAGFWMGNPDIDAVSRLFWPIRVTDMKPDFAPTFGLFPDTWCAFNNQNTAMAREILPAYLTPPNSLRFSDLFPAYVICKIAGHLNHVIAYGYPFARHPRNPHNLWNDMEKEMIGAQASETLIEMLRSVELTSKNYHDCLGEINKQFEKDIVIVKKLPIKQRDMLLDFINNLKIYHEVFNSIHE
jgi:hypothetical protein